MAEATTPVNVQITIAKACKVCYNVVMYGEGRNSRYLIGLGLVIVLLFIVIFMIVRGGGDNSAKVPETKRELTSYAGEENVRITMTTIGPITSPDTHRESQVSISNSQSIVEAMQGYDGAVVASRAYPMSTESFREFLSALEKVNFTEGDSDEKLQDDRGYCATGQRYIFEIYQGAKEIQRFWATSCGGPKTYNGELNRTLNLFQAQIPDYNDVVGSSGVRDESFLGL
jgi:hypothetical protein